MTPTEYMIQGLKHRIGRLDGSRPVLITPSHQYGHYILDMQDGLPPVSVNGPNLYKWLNKPQASWLKLLAILDAKRTPAHKKQLTLDL